MQHQRYVALTSPFRGKGSTKRRLLEVEMHTVADFVWMFDSANVIKVRSFQCALHYRARLLMQVLTVSVIFGQQRGTNLLNQVMFVPPALDLRWLGAVVTSLFCVWAVSFRVELLVSLTF